MALISQLLSAEVSPTNGDFQNELALEEDKIFSRDEILSLEPMVRENSDDSWFKVLSLPLSSQYFKFL